MSAHLRQQWRKTALRFCAGTRHEAAVEPDHPEFDHHAAGFDAGPRHITLGGKMLPVRHVFQIPGDPNGDLPTQTLASIPLENGHEVTLVHNHFPGHTKLKWLKPYDATISRGYGHLVHPETGESAFKDFDTPEEAYAHIQHLSTWPSKGQH